MATEEKDETTRTRKPITGDAQIEEAVKLIESSKKLSALGLDKRSRAELIRAAGELLGDAWRNLKEEARAEEAAAAEARKAKG